MKTTPKTCHAQDRAKAPQSGGTESIVEARRHLQELARAQSPALALPALQGLLDFANRSIHEHKGSAHSQVTQLADALAGLLKSLVKRPAQTSDSVRKTLGGAVDVLQMLQEQPVRPAVLPQDFHALAVDDCPVVRQLITRALERIDLPVRACGDPRQVPGLLESIQCPLILLDLNMPNMKGDELSKTIRELPNYANVPIIFITAENDLSTRARLTLSGGTDYICKPFLVGELTVKSLINLRRWRFTADEGRAAPAPAKPATCAPPASKSPPSAAPQSARATAQQRFSARRKRLATAKSSGVSS